MWLILESEQKTCVCVGGGKESVKNYSSLQNNHFWRERSNLKFLLVVLPRKKSFKVEHDFNISMLLKSEDIASLESALRIYNGKPAVYLYSSIAEEILPLAKKYGALIVTDQIGMEKALSFGINKKEIVLEEIFS